MAVAQAPAARDVAPEAPDTSGKGAEGRPPAQMPNATGLNDGALGTAPAASGVYGADVQPKSMARDEHKQRGAKHERTSRGALDKSDKQDGGEAEAKKSIKLKARVLARAEWQQQNAVLVSASGEPEHTRFDTLDLSVRSARFGVKYRAPFEWLSAELEIEATRRFSLKDAFIEAEGAQLSAKAGQFKVPFSALEMTSIWDLPLADRGFLHNILVDRLDVAGRRPGVSATFRDRSGLRPQLTLGTFQGSVMTEVAANDRDTELLADQKLETQSPAARGQVKSGDVKVGVSYEHRVGSPALAETEYYWTLGVDTVYDADLGPGVLRVWLDGVVGSSWYEQQDKAEDESDATFLLGRMVTGYRFGGKVKTAFYVEPFAALGALDPDLEVTSDLALEAILGINVGLWDRARLTLQGDLNRVARNFPSAYAVGSDPDRLGLLLQAGVNF